jgi:hypothetical protein
MRLIRILLTVSGLFLLMIKFSFDVRYQNENSPLRIFGYYAPAFLSIAAVIWILMHMIRKQPNDPKSLYLNLVIIGLAGYAMAWQFLYLKYIFSRLFSGGIEIYLMELFPLLTAFICAGILLIIKVRNLTIN